MEKNLSDELYNDFLTVWSKYLSSGKIEDIFLDLTCLAELGQVNALQKFFQYAPENTKNMEIDYQVKGLKRKYSLTSDELLVFANKIRFDKKDYYDRVDEKVTNANNEVIKYELDILNEKKKAKALEIEPKIDDSLKKALNQKKQKLASVRSKALKTKYYKLQNYALAAVMKTYKNSKGIEKALAYEKALEFNFSKFGFEKEKLFDNKTKESMKAYLMKAYTSTPENAQVAFALAQDIQFFIVATGKELEMRNTILDNLKNREYSDKLKAKISLKVEQNNKNK